MAASRVVIISDSFAGRGGATDVAVAEVLALKSRGVAITLFAGEDGLHPALADQDVELIALGERPILEVAPLTGGVRGLFNRRAARALTDWIERNDSPTTVYHLHNWSHILSPAIFRPLGRVRQRLLLTIHDYFIACPNGGFLNYQSDQTCPLTPLSLSCLSTHCDRRNYSHKLWRVGRQIARKVLFDIRVERPMLLILHELMVPYLVRGDIPEELLRVLRNPITPFTSDRVAAERNDLLVFVGRLEREKGPDLAARAARSAGVKLRFIGDGPMRAELEKEFPEFEYAGWVDQSAIGSLVSDARALVMPSRVPEPFGMAAVQALWSGLPVILSKDALLASEIEDSGAGFCCDPRDIEELSRGISALFADDDLAARMSHKAIAETHHIGNTPDRWADDLLQAINERVST